MSTAHPSETLAKTSELGSQDEERRGEFKSYLESLITPRITTQRKEWDCRLLSIEWSNDNRSTLIKWSIYLMMNLSFFLNDPVLSHVFKVDSVSLTHTYSPTYYTSSEEEEEENEEFCFEFIPTHLCRYYVKQIGSDSNFLLGIKSCDDCCSERILMKVDPRSAGAFEKPVEDMFRQYDDIVVDVEDINRQIDSVVRNAVMIADIAREEGRKTMGMEVQVVFWTNFLYDQEEKALEMSRLDRAAADDEDECFGYLPASRSAIDNLEKIMMDEENFVCPICLKVLEIDTEVLQLPCSHKFHPSCITKWLGGNHICPYCRLVLPD
ncbi:hypothetical protein Sjap_015782 [Stephania japonica]|uniref:RING-type domain-containing protein n=1 Tax=Stephania japonica TaxID=461633 RepID=A0AAP0IKK5_9MAGN